MGAHTKQTARLVLLFLMISCFLWNCGDTKEALKAPVVSKKIAVPKVEASAQKNKATDQTTVSWHPPGRTESAVEKTTASTRIYDPKNRVNPFTPLFKAEKPTAAIEKTADKASKKKRIPKTPLEKIGLDQLKLVATIRAPSGNKGLVEDSKGKGYIIKKGTYIGLNAGIVTQINADRVVIEEEMEDLMGALTLKNTEIKLQKPAGE